MRNSWPCFAALLFAVHFSWWTTSTGMGNFEQPLLIETYGWALSDTAWPALAQNVAFAARVFVGAASDTWSPFGLGYRLPYIVAGQLCAAGGLLLAGLVPPVAGGAGAAVYTFAALLRALGIVTAFCAMDGLIVDANIPAAMGLVAQVRGTGQVGGLLVANQGGGPLAQFHGLAALAFFLAACAAPLAALPLAAGRCVVEERSGAGGARAKGPPWRQLLAELAKPRALAITAVACLTFLGQTVANFALNVFLRRKGVALTELGHLNTVFAVGGWVGSFAGGWALDRCDVRASSLAAQLVNAALTIAVLWTPAQGAFGFNAGLNAAGGFATGWVNSTLFGSALRVAPREFGSSFMAVIAGSTNVMGLLGNVVGQQITQLEDKFTLSFAVGAALLGASALVVPLWGDAALPPAKPAREQGAGAAEKMVNPLAAAAAAGGGALPALELAPLPLPPLPPPPLPPAAAASGGGPLAAQLPGAAAEAVAEWGDTRAR